MPVGLKKNINYTDFKKNIQNIVTENPELVQEIKTLLLDEQKTATVISPKKQADSQNLRIIF